MVCDLWLSICPLVLSGCICVLSLLCPCSQNLVMRASGYLALPNLTARPCQQAFQDGGVLGQVKEQDFGVCR
jgi:hypothetical protein